jgi:hypothetical protein
VWEQLEWERVEEWELVAVLGQVGLEWAVVAWEA